MRISDYIRTYSVENGSLITSLTGDTWGVLGAHMTAFGSGYTGDTATVTVTSPGAVTGGAAIEGIVTDGEIRSCRVTSAGQYQQAAGVIDTSYYYLIARLGSSSFTGADEQGRIFLGNGATISGTGYVAAIPILTFGGTGTGAAGIAIVGPTSLDAIPTLDLQEGKQVSVRLDDTTLSMWRLVSATDAEDGTTVIRPGDYDDLPVKMVWKLQTTSTAVPANLSVTTLTTTGNITSGGDVILSNSGAVRLPDADGSNYIELQAANVVATNTVYKFPEDGAAGQVLSTDGGGNLSWTSTGAASQNLSTTDQVLTGNRNVTLNGSTLTFTGSSDSFAFDTAGNVTASGNLTVSGNTSLQAATVTTLSTTGNLTAGASTIFGGVAYSWPGADGSGGQFLSTDGSGNLTWVSESATTTDTSLANTNQTLTGARNITLSGNALDIAGSAATWTYASTGHASTTGNLTVSGTTALQGVTATTITASGAATFNSAADFNGAVTLDAGATVSSNPLTVTSSFVSSGTNTLGATSATSLTVSGASSMQGATATTLTTSGALVVGSTTGLGGVTYTWPGAAGTNGQFLTTDGSGGLSWTTAATGGTDTSLSDTNQTLTGDRDITLSGNTLDVVGSAGTWTWASTGAASTTGNLTVSGITSLQGATTTTLSTSGAVTHAAAVTHNSTADFNGAITIDAGATVNTSPLTIAGSTSLVVNGVLDSNSTADFSGAANFTGTTSFSNTNTFTGDISANNTSVFSDTLVATNVVSFTGASAVGMAGTNSLSGTNLFSGTNSFSSTARMLNGTGITFFDSDNSNTTILQANPTTTSNVTYSLPAADGASGQVLQTNGSGLLSWTNQTAAGSDTNLGNTDQTLTAARSVSINGQSLNIAGTAATWTYASTGHATTTGNLTVAGTTALAGTTATTLTTSGAVVHGSTVTFNGATDFNAAANFDNGVTVNNNPLVVSGTTTAQVNGVLDVNGIADFAGASTFTGTTSFSNTNTFTGAISASNTASFTGTLTASNSVSFTGSSAVGMAGTNGFTGTNIFSGTNSFTATARMLNGNGVTFFDSDNSNTTILRAAPTTTSNVTYSLPPADGTSGQVLQTNGSGVLSWTTASGGTPLGGADQTLTSSRDVNFNGNNLSFTGSGGTWAWQGDGDLICSNVDFYWGAGLHRYGLYSNAVPVDGDYWFDAASDREAFRNTNTYYKSGYAFVGIGGSAISITAGTFFECLVHPTSIGSLSLSANTFDQSRIIRIIHNAEMFYTTSQLVQWRSTINGSNAGIMSEPANFNGPGGSVRVRFSIDIAASNNGLGTVTYKAIGTMTFLDNSSGAGNTWCFDNSASVALSSGAAVTIGMGVSYNQSNDEVYIPLSTSVEII